VDEVAVIHSDGLLLLTEVLVASGCTVVHLQHKVCVSMCVFFRSPSGMSSSLDYN
jgi:hypothetical protein